MRYWKKEKRIKETQKKKTQLNHQIGGLAGSSFSYRFLIKRIIMEGHKNKVKLIYPAQYGNSQIA